MPSNNPKIEEKTEVTANGRKPSEQALQAVDVAVGAGPTVAEAVRTTAETWSNSETRSMIFRMRCCPPGSKKRVMTRRLSLANVTGRRLTVSGLRRLDLLTDDI